MMRSTDEFATVQKKLLQDALTDTLTQLPNRRNGMDFWPPSCFSVNPAARRWPA